MDEEINPLETYNIRCMYCDQICSDMLMFVRKWSKWVGILHDDIHSSKDFTWWPNCLVFSLYDKYHMEYSHYNFSSLLDMIKIAGAKYQSYNEIMNKYGCCSPAIYFTKDVILTNLEDEYITQYYPRYTWYDTFHKLFKSIPLTRNDILYILGMKGSNATTAQLYKVLSKIPIITSTHLIKLKIINTPISHK